MWRSCEMLCSFLLRFWHRRFQLLSSYPVESLGTHPLSRESIDRLTTVIFDTSLHSEPSWEVECKVSYCTAVCDQIWESNTYSAYVHFSITIRFGTVLTRFKSTISNHCTDQGIPCKRGAVADSSGLSIVQKEPPTQTHSTHSTRDLLGTKTSHSPSWQILIYSGRWSQGFWFSSFSFSMGRFGWFMLMRKLNFQVSFKAATVTKNHQKQWLIDVKGVGSCPWSKSQECTVYLQV